MKHEDQTAESFNGFFKRGVELFDRVLDQWELETGEDWTEARDWLKDANTLIRLVDEQHRQYLAGTDDIIAGFDIKRRKEGVSRETETET